MFSRQLVQLPVPMFASTRHFALTTFLVTTAVSIIGCSGARAADGDANEVLMKKLAKMEQRIEMLEAELKQKQTASAEKQTSSSGKSGKSATVQGSPKDANAAAPPDQRDAPGEPGSKSKDRKSTRLNSSHVSTSYAVFCLKK